MVYGLNDQGGGQALPPYLQGRTRAPTGYPYQTQPMITPKSTVFPGEATGFKPMTPRPALPGLNITPRAPGPAVPPGLPGITGTPRPNLPPGLSVGPTAPGNSTAATGKPDQQTLFEFLKKDLENERNSALSNARSDAANRGVFYGTPLTTSEGDINTSFLRGLGQLQSGLIQNEQSNELARLGLASNLIGSPPSFNDLSQLGQGNPEVYGTIGSLFAGQQPPQGPAITPNVAPSAQGQPIQGQPAPFKPQLPFRPGQQPIKPVNPINLFNGLR